jgi:alpha-1,3-rhamnosyl/mannosyltransferase
MQRLGVAKKVHLLAGVDDKTLRWLYCQAAALVFPSLYEGFGIPLLEALACGCPVVASSIPSTQEIVAGCPFYFEVDDVESMWEALQKALTEGRTPERIERGLSQARLYSWNDTAQKTLDVFAALI